MLKALPNNPEVFLVTPPPMDYRYNRTKKPDDCKSKCDVIPPYFEMTCNKIKDSGAAEYFNKNVISTYN